MGAQDLARLVAQRRAELGLSQEEAVAKAKRGISTSNWSKIENGREGPYRQSTYAAIDRALDWPAGSAQDYAFRESKGMNDPVFLPEIDEGDVSPLRERVARLEDTLRSHETRIARLENLLAGAAGPVVAVEILSAQADASFAALARAVNDQFAVAAEGSETGRGSGGRRTHRPTPPPEAD